MTKARTIVVSNACIQLSAINVQIFEVAQALSVNNLFLDHHVFEEFEDNSKSLLYTNLMRTFQLELRK